MTNERKCLAVSSYFHTFAYEKGTNMNAVNITAPQQVVTIDDASMLDKIKNAIKSLNGVRHIYVVKPKETELDLAREDKAKGKSTKWNSVDETPENK